jgi:hypothetical protein
MKWIERHPITTAYLTFILTLVILFEALGFK